MNENITICRHDNGDSNIRQDFTVTVFGNRVLTTVTRQAWILKKWIYNIRRDHRLGGDRLVVGFGVQWRPTMSYNRVATLQLCVGCQCMIFQLIHATSIPQLLRRFLSDVSITFVGVENHNDSRLLMRDYKLSVHRLFELGSVAGLTGASMETLASEILGFHDIQKPEWICRSDWDERWLTDYQVRYACVNAYLSCQIGNQLLHGCDP